MEIVRSLARGTLRMAVWLGLVLSWAPAQADEAMWKLLEQGGQIVLIRHGLTDPGVGDPPGFTLADCATQRNLSAVGREEARRLGEAFRKRGIVIARLLSSPWCRCLETARIAFREPVPEPALANLFGNQPNQDRQVAAFRKLVATFARDLGRSTANAPGNLVLVTHGSTTAAFTGINQETTGMVIVTPGGGEKYRVAGRLAPSSF